MKLLFFVFLYLIATVSYAAQCGPAGKFDVVKTDDGRGYIFYAYRNDWDAFLVLPGSNYHVDEKAPRGKTEFFLDGIHYAIAIAPISEFVKEKTQPSADVVLDRYVAWTRDSMAAAKSKLSVLKDLGNRNKPGSGISPNFTFKLWQLSAPNDPKAPYQYFLSTVSGKEVVTFSAIIQDRKFDQQALRAIVGWTTTFQFVTKENCLNATSPPNAPAKK